MRLLALLFFSISSFALCQTPVSGGIYQNTSWTLAGSPYIVNGSVVVFPGVTLNIEPGVEIRINNQTSNSIYIETRGTLNCVGTDLLPIKIHAMYDTLNPVGWQGFTCSNSQGGVLNADRFHISNAHTPFGYGTALTNYQYTNCIFSHCFQAVTVAVSVNLQNCQFIDNEVGVYGYSYFSIDNCLFKDNTTSIFAYASSLQMTNSSFIDNQIGLTFVANALDSISISDCQFINNELALNYPNNGTVQNCLFSENTTAIEAANNCEIFNNEFLYNDLALEASVAANIHDNQINNNVGGLIISSDVLFVQDSPLIYNNEICNNVYFNVNNNTNLNYSLLSNCFCDLDSAQIENLLIDGYDDITKGLINYQIFDSSCNNLLRTIIKFGEGLGLEKIDLDLSFENPVGAELLVFAKAEIATIEVKDLSGKTYIFSTTGMNQFDVSRLPAGFYVLNMVNQQATRKTFIKI